MIDTHMPDQVAWEAPYVILAWPRYDSQPELDSMMEMVGAALSEHANICLCLRHDPDRDEPFDELPPGVHDAHARMLGRQTNLDLLLLDDPIRQEDWPQIGEAAACVLRLPSSADSERAAFLAAMDLPVIDSPVGLRTAVRLWSAERSGPAPSGDEQPENNGNGGATASTDKDAIHRWLEKAYDDCVPYFPPVRLDIALTTACNLNCAYCWQREKGKTRLTFDVLADIADSIAAIWPPNITFTGGEPTVWPDFERFVSHCKDIGVTNMLLCTNGIKLRDLDFAERLVAAGLTAINVSVDTLDPERFESLRSYPFSKFKKTLDNCAKLNEKFPHLHIALASVLSKAITPEDLHQVKTFCNENDFGYFMQTFLPTQDPEVNERFVLAREEHEAFERKLGWLEGRVADVVKREENPLTESNTEKCYKGITTAKIFPDGGVAYCWTSRRIGNIFDQPFIDLWTSEQAKQMREFIRDRKCNCKFDCDIYESLELLGSARRVSSR